MKWHRLPGSVGERLGCAFPCQSLGTLCVSREPNSLPVLWGMPRPHPAGCDAAVVPIPGPPYGSGGRTAGPMALLYLQPFPRQPRAPYKAACAALTTKSHPLIISFFMALNSLWSPAALVFLLQNQNSCHPEEVGLRNFKVLEIQIN